MTKKEEIERMLKEMGKSVKAKPLEEKWISYIFGDENCIDFLMNSLQLFEKYKGTIHVNDVIKECKITESQARYILEKFYALNVLKKEKHHIKWAGYQINTNGGENMLYKIIEEFWKYKDGK